MSLKRIRDQLERHVPDPHRPLPHLLVSCMNEDHTRTVYLIRVNEPRLKFPSLEAAHAWIQAQDNPDAPVA